VLVRRYLLEKEIEKMFGNLRGSRWFASRRDFSEVVVFSDLETES
jgi:hypothetical protein